MRFRLTGGGFGPTIQVEVNFKSSTFFAMDISEVARRAGVPASTLRYYEGKGLIASLGPQGSRRRFAPAVLDQLALIALGQAAGLSLDEIHAMLSPSGGPKIDRTLLASKADEIDRTVRHLQAMSRGLRHAAACPAPSHAECPTFRRLLKAAASRALDGRRLAREHGRATAAAARARSAPNA
jgi:DNA-binding transcriptional MerR regulator